MIFSVMSKLSILPLGYQQPHSIAEFTYEAATVVITSTKGGLFGARKKQIGIMLSLRFADCGASVKFVFDSAQG